jgi:hypothetical protein
MVSSHGLSRDGPGAACRGYATTHAVAGSLAPNLQALASRLASHTTPQPAKVAQWMHHSASQEYNLTLLLIHGVTTCYGPALAES